MTLSGQNVEQVSVDTRPYGRSIVLPLIAPKALGMNVDLFAHWQDPSVVVILISQDV